MEVWWLRYAMATMYLWQLPSTRTALFGLQIEMVFRIHLYLQEIQHLSCCALFKFGIHRNDKVVTRYQSLMTSVYLC